MCYEKLDGKLTVMLSCLASAANNVLLIVFTLCLRRCVLHAVDSFVQV